MNTTIYSMSKEIVKINVENKSEEISLIAAGDFHIGADCHNNEAFDVFIQQMLEETKKRQTYLILMGDLFDAISLIGDKRLDQHSRKKSMDQSIEDLSEKLIPLLKTKRFHFVGALTGNHELSYCRGDVQPILSLYRVTGQNVQGKGITPLGLKAYIYFDLYQGKTKLCTLRTVAFHGSSSSRLEHGRVRIIRDFLKEESITHDDFFKMNKIVFYGHTHSLKVEKSEKIIPKPRQGKFCNLIQYGCLTGTFHDIANFDKTSYAVKAGYSPAVVGYIKTIFSFNELQEPQAISEGLNPNIEKCVWHE